MDRREFVWPLRQWSTWLVLAEKEKPCPFVNLPLRAGARWALPQIKVRVRFLEYADESVMRAPAVAGFPEGF